MTKRKISNQKRRNTPPPHDVSEPFLLLQINYTASKYAY